MNLSTTNIIIKKASKGFLATVLTAVMASCSDQKLTVSDEPGGDSAQPQSRPNFLLIVADDLAYSDLGAFGGEIETPTLDRLATEGIRFSSFYSSPTCSPTRSMLLTGTDNHIAGLGNMAEAINDNQRGKPGYEGYLNNRVITIASVLQQSGYQTYMSGKWHLGMAESQSPSERGFERSFALLQGGAGHFDNTGLIKRSMPALYREDGKYTEWPEGGYSSDVYADKLIEYLDQSETDKPFFAYLAFTAPHWPLQAPDALIEKYRGKYDGGWDELLIKRVEKMQSLGLIKNVPDVNPPFEYKPWAQLSSEEKQIAARKMEVYAAMVESLDNNIARVLDHLEAHDQLENTIVIFLSDNGAEGLDLGEVPLFAEHIATFDNSYENIGRPNSYTYLGPSWGYATTTVRRLFKSHTTEGGIRVPAIVWQANAPSGGKVYEHALTVMDVAPTLFDLANLDSLDALYQQGEFSALRGKSFVQTLANAENPVHAENQALSWELFGRRAARQGDWKILWDYPPNGKGDWELFDLKNDPGEANDLSLQYPEKRQELIKQWESYAAEVGVILPDSKPAVSEKVKK